MILNKPFIFMKVGFHGEESLEEILERKTREEMEAGFIFWGYGGGPCHPTKQVQPFAEKGVASNEGPIVLMSLTSSKFEKNGNPAKEFSLDGYVWQPIPSGIKVTASRHALVIRKLQSCKIDIDLDSYAVALGPSAGTLLSDYIKGRVDKGCAVLQSDANRPQAGNPITIALTAELVAPYAVFLR